MLTKESQGVAEGVQPNDVRGVAACCILETEDLFCSRGREHLVAQLLSEVVDVPFDLGDRGFGEELVQGLTTAAVQIVVLGSES